MMKFRRLFFSFAYGALACCALSVTPSAAAPPPDQDFEHEFAYERAENKSRQGDYSDAPDKISQDEIRAAVRSGAMRPLSEIERQIAGKLPGDVIDVEVEREGQDWQYEFKTLDARGLRYDVYIDAKTGRILKALRR